MQKALHFEITSQGNIYDFHRKKCITSDVFQIVTEI